MDRASREVVAEPGEPRRVWREVFVLCRQMRDVVGGTPLIARKIGGRGRGPLPWRRRMGCRGRQMAVIRREVARIDREVVGAGRSHYVTGGS
jgi:hypothetical protein